MIQTYNTIALARKVLAVAVIMQDDSGSLIDWAVYIDAVAGKDHESEYLIVADKGSKQSIGVANTLFPHINIDKYRR